MNVELCHAPGNFSLELLRELQFGAVASIVVQLCIGFVHFVHQHELRAEAAQG